VRNAIAEFRRRVIIGRLAGGLAYTVGTLERTLRSPQPAVSNHLGVLRQVARATTQKQGQQCLY